MDNKIELKVCPFCGGQAKLVFESPLSFYTYVRCSNCGARTRSEYLEQESIRVWNRRFLK